MKEHRIEMVTICRSIHIEHLDFQLQISRSRFGKSKIGKPTTMNTRLEYCLLGYGVKGYCVVLYGEALLSLVILYAFVTPEINIDSGIFSKAM